MVLWSHAIGALGRANPDVAKSTSSQSLVAPVIDRVLPRLVNELDGQGEITLILDDFHRISSEPALASVRWFIEHAPPGFHVVIATRTEPSLPVASLRAHGELVELRAADLRFTYQEADAFLNGRLGLDLTAEDIESLVEKTEGWPAGLYLAGAFVAGRRRPPRLRANIQRIEPSRRGFPGDGGTRGPYFAGAGADAPYFDSRTADRPSLRRRDGPRGLGGDARRAARGATCSLSRSTMRPGRTAFTTSLRSCSGWSSNGGSRAWPRSCIAAPTRGIVITGRPTRRSSTPWRPRLTPKQSS